MAKYLVTGAAGFIGSNIVATLLDEGETVIGFDNLSTGKIENLDFIDAHPNRDNFAFLREDIRDKAACESAARGVDFVLHQAALGSVPRSIEQPELYNDNNITGTLNMLVAAKDAGVKRFVFASSSSVYGDTPVLPKVESMFPEPKSPYALGKLAGEYYCKIFNAVYGLPTVAFRYFNVFGPKQDPNSQYAAVIPKFVTACLSGESPTIHGDGEQTRDFTYIDNVVRINLLACKADPKACGRVYNVGCGSRISVNQLLAGIQKNLGTNVAANYGPARAGDVRDSLADIQLSQEFLGVKELVKLEDGLARTVAWFREAYVAGARG